MAFWAAALPIIKEVGPLLGQMMLSENKPDLNVKRGNIKMPQPDQTGSEGAMANVGMAVANGLSGAMSRRMEQNQEPVGDTLIKAQKMLDQAPPEYQQKYGPVINQAIMLAKRDPNSGIQKYYNNQSSIG